MGVARESDTPLYANQEESGWGYSPRVGSTEGYNKPQPWNYFGGKKWYTASEYDRDQQQIDEERDEQLQFERAFKENANAIEDRKRFC